MAPHRVWRLCVVEKPVQLRKSQQKVPPHRLVARVEECALPEKPRVREVELLLLEARPPLQLWPWKPLR